VKTIFRGLAFKVSIIALNMIVFLQITGGSPYFYGYIIHQVFLRCNHFVADFCITDGIEPDKSQKPLKKPPLQAIFDKKTG
jgi:hypothetical protein